MNIININRNDISLTICKDDRVFGDGNHETTAFMLDSIDKYDLKGKDVIDVGTGTGILSIYAKLKGAKRVFAVDADPHALEFARENALKNKVNIEVEINDLTYNLSEKADVVLANLTGVLQVENIKSAGRVLKDNGIMIITWQNNLPFDEYNRGFNWQVVDHVEGEEYDGYVLKKE